MPRIVPLLVLALSISWVSGCAGSREYMCPEPIGLIIRDDCDVYKTRYESMRIDLEAGIGPAKVGAGISEQALRSPSELIQVMSARMTALCHDFNACRLTPADYQRRRTEIDKTMTALMALGEQLKRRDLTERERGQLLEKLMRMLGEPAPRIVKPGSKNTKNDKKPRVRKRAFFSSKPWFDSLMRPPIAPPVEEGFPRLVTGWGRPTLDHAWIPKSPDKPHHKKIGGYRPRVYLTLMGHIEADDRLEIRFHDGRKHQCPVRKNADGINSVRCKLPDEIYFGGDHYGFEAGYFSALKDKWATLGSLGWKVIKSIGGSYEIDYSERTRQGYLYFIPEPRHTPPDFERPHLYTTLQLRDYRKPTARCWIGKEAVTGAIRPSRGSGQTGSFQDRPRYEKIGPHSSRAVKDPFLEWWRFEFPLPYVVPRGKGNPPEGLSLWPPKKGRHQWRCRVTIDGEPVRELRFEIGEDGKPIPLEGQRGEPGDSIHPWWKIETTILPNEVEATREGSGAGS